MDATEDLKQTIARLLPNGLGARGDEERNPVIFPARNLHVLLAVSGSVASIKAPLIVRELLKVRLGHAASPFQGSLTSRIPAARQSGRPNRRNQVCDALLQCPRGRERVCGSSEGVDRRGRMGREPNFPSFRARSRSICDVCRAGNRLEIPFCTSRCACS